MDGLDVGDELERIVKRDIAGFLKGFYRYTKLDGVTSEETVLLILT